jgi:very-short-patch-repair endonuclease
VPKRDERLLSYAKQMRRERTPAEEKFWSMVRAGRVDGVKFSNQVLVCGFLADFAAHARKLVVEIDGDSHDLTFERDQMRTAVLERNGYRVVRFWNDDVLNNADGVLVVLKEAIRTAPLPTDAPRRSALSPVGRGRKSSHSPEREERQ